MILQFSDKFAYGKGDAYADPNHAIKSVMISSNNDETIIQREEKCTDDDDDEADSILQSQYISELRFTERQKDINPMATMLFKF